LEARRRQLELENCTFKPKIDSKSNRIASNHRMLASSKSYEVLYGKHDKKMEKAKKLL